MGASAPAIMIDPVLFRKNPGRETDQDDDDRQLNRTM
jgi:hypothetical protein